MNEYNWRDRVLAILLWVILPLACWGLLVGLTLGQSPRLSGVTGAGGPQATESEALDEAVDDAVDGLTLAYFLYGDRVEVINAQCHTGQDNYGDWYAHCTIWFWIHAEIDPEDA